MAEATPGINFRGKKRTNSGVTKVTPGTTYGDKIRNARSDAYVGAMIGHDRANI